MAEKRQFNIRISQNAYEKMEVLLKNATTNKCPTCGNETEIEFSKFKGLKPTSLASQLLEEMINELTIKPKLEWEKYNQLSPKNKSDEFSKVLNKNYSEKIDIIQQALKNGKKIGRETVNSLFKKEWDEGYRNGYESVVKDFNLETLKEIEKLCYSKEKWEISDEEFINSIIKIVLNKNIED